MRLVQICRLINNNARSIVFSLENLLVTYYYIAIFDDCVFLLFFVQVDKMRARNKKLEDEFSTDLSTVY